MRALVIAAALVASGAAAPPAELVVHPGEPVAATVNGRPARLLVHSDGLDRLTLDPDYVASIGLRPTLLFGRGDLKLSGHTEFEGRNGPVSLRIADAQRRTRAFWFDRAPDSGVDGRIGPWGLPQPRVAFVLGSTAADETTIGAPMFGDDTSSSYTGIKVGEGGMGVSFDVDGGGRVPVATAAAGALLAQTFGGSLSGPSWDVEILMGVRRPVRLLTLDRPFRFGNLAFRRIAVRVRDRIDDSGRGAAIADADADPDEVVVVGKSGAKPNYGLTIPRAGLSTCSRLTFDRTAKRVELACRDRAAD